jgi:hypothetical protein
MPPVADDIGELTAIPASVSLGRKRRNFEILRIGLSAMDFASAVIVITIIRIAGHKYSHGAANSRFAAASNGHFQQVMP